MVIPLNRVMAGVAVLAIAAAVTLGIRLVEAQDAAQLAHIAPFAEDALTQSVDLNRIAGFRYVNDRMFEVTDEVGRKYKMEFTEACPGLKDAKDFSLVTESYRDMDRFTGIALQGRICTFKDFSPKT
jgi:hypothetical protein